MSTFVCDICEASYARRDGLQRHKKQKHPDQLEPVEKSAFSCSFCDKSYTMRKNLLKHCRQSHPDETLESEHEEDDAVEKTAFACSFCDKSYSMRKNLLKHCRQSHPDEALESEHEEEGEETDGSAPKKSKVSCSHCSKAYSTMGNLSRHVKAEHPEFYDDPSQTLMDCPKCDSKFTRKSIMTKHLVDEHNYEDIHEEEQFLTWKKFSEWKDKMEKETLSSYVKPRGSSVVKAGTRIDYICHRSGVFHEKGTEGRHFHLQTRKCGYICPARLIVTISPDESVNVMWHKNHFAHEVGIRFLRLTKAEREAIRTQVYEGRSFERILDDVREAALEQGQFSRLSVLQRRDLWNIMRGYVVNTKRAHSNDYLSVEAIVSGLREKKQNPVLFYKAQDKPCDCAIPGCPLQPEDFMLVLSTPWQRQVFQQYGAKQILIDSTHGTNAYDFQLTTLMSVDECGVGVPLAFCLGNHVDEDHMAKFFEVIRESVGVVQTQIFMADMAPAFYNAWKRVMTAVANILFCSWHVHRAWKKNATEKVKGFEKQVEVYRAACVLMELMDLELLDVCLQGFMDMMEGDEDMKEFAQYFKKHYFRNPETWAYCHRLGLGLNTNMFLEAMHKKLKYSYMHGKQLRRIDECIDILLRYARDISIEQVTRIVNGNDSKRNRRIIESHKRSMEQFDEGMVAEVNEKTWTVRSSSRTDAAGAPLLHTVTVNEDDHCLGCQLACMRCRICVHSFNCSCEDHLIRNNMCKHIHAVARFSTSARCDFSEADVCRQIDDHIETLCDTAPEVGHVAEAVEEPHIWAAVRSNLTYALNKCDETCDRTLLEMSVNLLGEIRKRLPPSTNAAMPSLPPLPSMPCTPNKRNQRKENMRTPGSVSRLVPGASPLTPHNVKITPQRTPRKTPGRAPAFHSTKNHHSAKRALSLSKADAVESEAILRRLANNE